jgi:hypothetical protein
MMVNDAMLMNAGYGHWGADGRPVVVHSHSGAAVLMWIVGICIVIVIVVVAIKIL